VIGVTGAAAIAVWPGEGRPRVTVLGSPVPRKDVDLVRLCDNMVLVHVADALKASLIGQVENGRMPRAHDEPAYVHTSAAI